MNKNTKIKVRNRSTGTVGYVIPDMGNYHRKFQPDEVKEVSFEEIQKLSYTPGGNYMLQHYLVIDNAEARDEILGDMVEIEYNYTQKDIERLLTSGSLDELLDCLDFAPKGVVEMLQKTAVEIELNDVKKRKAIQDVTGFNVNNAILINQESNEETTAAEAPQRRVAQPTTNSTEPAAPARRFNVSQK